MTCARSYPLQRVTLLSKKILLDGLPSLVGYPFQWVTLISKETLFSVGYPFKWVCPEVADSSTSKTRSLSTCFQDAYEAANAPTCKLLTHLLAMMSYANNISEFCFYLARHMLVGLGVNKDKVYLVIIDKAYSLQKDKTYPVITDNVYP